MASELTVTLTYLWTLQTYILQNLPTHRPLRETRKYLCIGLSSDAHALHSSSYRARADPSDSVSVFKSPFTDPEDAKLIDPCPRFMNDAERLWN